MIKNNIMIVQNATMPNSGNKKLNREINSARMMKRMTFLVNIDILLNYRIWGYNDYS